MLAPLSPVVRQHHLRGEVGGPFDCTHDLAWTGFPKSDMRPVRRGLFNQPRAIASSAARAGRSIGAMTRVSVLAASLASMLCMATLFVTVALAAGPPPVAGAPASHAQGVCFLHALLP